MLTELAHYLMIFSAAVFGLQAGILIPLLWDKASAVSIKLAYRGILFGCMTLFLCFCILIFCYVRRDFSLALVFENYATDLSDAFLFQALFSAREGFFFIAILIFSIILLSDYRKALPTYLERGRYLFSWSMFLFFMTLLMIVTANPFVRLADPPLEGVSLNPYWKIPFMSVKMLCVVTGYGLLISVFLRMISVYEKGWRFVVPALTNSILAEIFLIFALAIDMLAAFSGTETQSILSWEPSSSLIFAVILITTAQCLTLHISQSSRSFGVWSLIFSMTGVVVIFSSFFAYEYNLFSVKSNKAYFPNPVTSFFATAGVITLVLFCAFSFVRKTLKETPFPLLSKETFFGLASAGLGALGIQLTVLSFSPVLLLFHAPLMWQNLPLFLTKQTLFYTLLCTLFLSASFVKGVTKPFEKMRKKLMLIYCLATGSLFSLLAFFYGFGSVRVLLWTCPALLLFMTVLNKLNFKIAPVPTNMTALWTRLKNVKMISYALFCTSLGCLLLSFSLSSALNMGSEKIIPLDLEKGTLIEHVRLELPESVAIDNIRQKPLDTIRIVSQKTGKEIFFYNVHKDLSAETSIVTQGIFFRFLNGFSLKIQATNETEIVCAVVSYPFLRLLPTAFFFVVTGLFLLFLCLKAKGKLAS